MDKLNDMINHATLQQLTRWLMYGNNEHIKSGNLDNQEDQAYKKLYASLHEYLDKETLLKIEPAINEYISELCEIYFNTGLKCGGKIVNQFLFNNSLD